MGGVRRRPPRAVRLSAGRGTPPTTLRAARLGSVGPVKLPPDSHGADALGTYPRTRSRLNRRLTGGLGLLALTILLGGCNVPSFWGYKGNTTQGHDEFKMYAFTVIAGIVVGGFVALLIVWAVLRYRRRNDEIPRQFQYHGPVEVLYTVIPVVIVLIIFGFTVASENNIDALAKNPAAEVKVTAFQWGWEFQYPSENITVLGHTTQDPDLVLPAGQTSQITLVSQDVIHGFYVPAFNFSRYAQPGVTNQFDLTPQAKPADYRAQCTQLCGLYHALMFFHVTTLAPADFQAWLQRNSGKSFIGTSSHLAASETGTSSS
jgi:cytochrome c oxidase subunit II